MTSQQVYENLWKLPVTARKVLNFVLHQQSRTTLNLPQYHAVWLCACPSQDSRRYISTDELNISIVIITINNNVSTVIFLAI